MHGINLNNNNAIDETLLNFRAIMLSKDWNSIPGLIKTSLWTDFRGSLRFSIYITYEHSVTILFG